MEPKSALTYVPSHPVTIPTRDLPNDHDDAGELSRSIDIIARQRIGLSTSPQAAGDKIDGLMNLTIDIDAKLDQMRQNSRQRKLNLLIEKANSLIEAYKLGANSQEHQDKIRETISKIQAQTTKEFQYSVTVYDRAIDVFYQITQIFKTNINWQFETLRYANFGRALCEKNNNSLLYQFTRCATFVLTGDYFY